jgi:chromosomal replication initiator protein
MSKKLLTFNLKAISGSLFKSSLISIKEIQTIICEHFDVPYDLVLQKTRIREVVQVRHISMHLSRLFINKSLINIGRHFNRDHSSITHASKAVNNLMSTDEEYNEAVIYLTGKVVINILINQNNIRKSL